MGNKGRVVVPTSIRSRHGWEGGSILVAVDTELGVLLADRSALEELAQKLRRVDSWQVARALLLSFPLQLASVTVDDAEVAAALRSEQSTLSLGDRLCLALAGRLDLDALAADRAWAGLDRAVLVR